MVNLQFPSGASRRGALGAHKSQFTILKIKLKRVVDDSYDIQIGSRLMDIARDINLDSHDSAIFVITDTNVGKLYGKSFLRALQRPASHLLIVRSGEKSKSRRTKELLEDKLLSLNLNRNSIIVAL